MKKAKLNPLTLDKKTIALLDANQLQDIIGGVNNLGGTSGVSVGCCTGYSACSNGGSTGCGAGSSTCRAIAL